MQERCASIDYVSRPKFKAFSTKTIDLPNSISEVKQRIRKLVRNSASMGKKAAKMRIKATPIKMSLASIMKNNVLKKMTI